MNPCRIHPSGYWIQIFAEFHRNQPGLEVAWRIQACKKAEVVVQVTYPTSAITRFRSRFFIHARGELVILQSELHSRRPNLHFLNLMSSRDLVPHQGIIGRKLNTCYFLKIVSSVYYVWCWPLGMHSTTGRKNWVTGPAHQAAEIKGNVDVGKLTDQVSGSVYQVA